MAVGDTKAEVFDYDDLGNRVTYWDHRNAVTTAYANNAVNEYTSIAGFGVLHDAAGNLSRQAVSGDGDAYEYSYDYDNRLVAIDYDPSDDDPIRVGAFAYDALGRLISSQMRFDSDVNADSATLKYYYDGQNEIAEVDETDAMQRRYVHGTTYIDERAVMIAGDPADEAPLIDTYYYLLEHLYTVTGLIKRNGTLAEANTYDAYGRVQPWGYRDFDFNRDGDVDSGDANPFAAAYSGAGNPTPDPTADFDMDGDVDGNTTTGDQMAFNNALTDTGTPPVTLFTSALGNPYHFTGRSLFFHEDPPCEGGLCPGSPSANNQIQYSRNRWYKPEDGRWMQRDPLRYADGPSLYEYVRCNPQLGLDPMGLRDWIDKVSDFIAGVGDSASMSLTSWIRKLLNRAAYGSWDESGVNYESGWYKTGEVVEVGVEITVSAGGLALRHIARNTVRKTVEGGAGDLYRRTHNLMGEGGFIHHRTPIKGHPVGMPGVGKPPPARYPLPFQWSAQGNWNMMWVETRADHYAMHMKMIRREALDRARELTLGTRQIGNEVVLYLNSILGCEGYTVIVGTSVYGDVTLDNQNLEVAPVLIPARGSASCYDSATSTIECHGAP